MAHSKKNISLTIDNGAVADERCEFFCGRPRTFPLAGIAVRTPLPLVIILNFVGGGGVDRPNLYDFLFTFIALIYF